MDPKTNPATKRKAASELPRSNNGDDLPAKVSLADFRRLERVTRAATGALEAFKATTLALTSRVDSLQRKNESLLLRCESLERSVGVLMSDAEDNWRYKAPFVDRDFWVAKGHSFTYGCGAEHLVELIEIRTNCLRGQGGLFDDDSNNGDPTNVRFSALTEIDILFSDSALYPHWEELANAMQLSDGVNSLEFTRIQLDQTTLRTIEASVRQKGLQKFRLEGNQFRGGEGVKFAIDVLNSNGTVNVFSWRFNPLHSNRCAHALLDAIMDHPTIRAVSFKGSLGYASIHPCALVTRLFFGLGRLLEADLSDNGIEPDGDWCILEFLSANPALVFLRLDGNQLTDTDALDIAKALRHNTNLRLLALDRNNLTNSLKESMPYVVMFGLNTGDTDFSQLYPARDNYTYLNGINLNTVSDANHTCEIEGVFHAVVKNELKSEGKAIRGAKLSWLLAQRHIEGQSMIQIESEFSEYGPGIVPHVLGCVNGIFGSHDEIEEGYEYVRKMQLSLLFELMRDWKTPEIYQLL